MAENDVVTLINEIDEFLELQKEFSDDDLDKALGYIVLLIHQPDMSPQMAPKAIVRLQALSAKFAVLATYYTSIAKGSPGTPENKKKNIYYTLAKETDKIAAALKYLAKPY